MPPFPDGKVKQITVNGHLDSFSAINGAVEVEEC